MLPVQQNYSLFPFNTFGMNVSAAWYSELSREAELPVLSSAGIYQNGIFLLGGGSNILFTRDVPHWVLHNRMKGIELLKEDKEQVWLRVGAGEVWHEFVLYCVAHNYGGVENLSLIPGTVGAAPVQNIGAYGVEIKDVLESVRCWNLETEAFEEYENADCGFGYRDSIFKGALKHKVIITSVVFVLNKHPVFNTSYGNIQQELNEMGVAGLSVKNISDAVIRIRSSKLPDPAIIGNAGSFFKNPEVTLEQFDALKSAFPGVPGFNVPGQKMKVPAGWLIEQCGWKGFREDDYGVHKNQALVLVNYGKAKGEDILHLSERIIASVAAQFGILLEREVQIF
jgi:UDP-N-acetylmuramate dehydrogenase